MRRTLITGANRGIGLELVRQCLERADHVFAACRNPSNADDLCDLGRRCPERMTILELEVTDEAAIDAAAEAVANRVDGLDLLINNAAVMPWPEKFSDLTAAQMLNTLHVNTVAPMMIAQRFLDLLRKGADPKIVNISSNNGSLTAKRWGGDYSYCGSKAALNMMTRALSFDLREAGVTAVVIHPGHVQTDMGMENAPLPPAESVEGLLSVIDGLTKEDTGRFYTWRGEEHPW